MGQRSQIYVRVDGNLEVANYYQWNYGDRMISRARYGMEWIQKYLKPPFLLKRAGYSFEKFRRIWDVNFDYKDITLSSDIFQEYELEGWGAGGTTLEKFCFEMQDNNDGKLFVDVNTEDERIAFTLTDNDVKILTPDQYMDWNEPGWRREDYEYLDKELKTACLNNIEWLNNNAKQMTEEELEEYIANPFVPFN